MTTFRRLFTTAGIAVAMCGFAQADTIITYTISIPLALTATDVVNATGTVTAWNPGGSNASDFIVPTSGPTMASLPSNAHLQFYDIVVSENVQGTIVIQNGNADAFGAANFSIDTQGALGINHPISTDGNFTNDVFGGAGPDPKKVFNVSGLAAGATTSSSFSITSTKDTGHLSDGATTAPPDPWTAYLFTFTSQGSSGLGGNGHLTFTDSVLATITVSYDYIIPSGTPEPTTMVLFGSALVGLGLIRKRIRS